VPPLRRHHVLKYPGADFSKTVLRPSDVYSAVVKHFKGRHLCLHMTAPSGVWLKTRPSSPSPPPG